MNVGVKYCLALILYDFIAVGRPGWAAIIDKGNKDGASIGC